MNQILELLQNNVFLTVVALILFCVIIYLLTDNFRDSFNDFSNFTRVPPHIENLSHQQMIPQKTLSEEAPNYGKTNQENTPQNTSMLPNNIYRRKTGRDAYEEEQFVSIYDSNFGGLLGTTLGLN